MDYPLDPEVEAFRKRTLAFLRDELPPDLAKRGRLNWQSDRADSAAWTAILHRHGWSAPLWPVEYGGTGWSALQTYLFEEECFAAGAPILNITGFTLVGPVIYSFGNDEQKSRFLPGILSGDTFWCQ